MAKNLFNRIRIQPIQIMAALMAKALFGSPAVGFSVLCSSFSLEILVSRTADMPHVPPGRVTSHDTIKLLLSLGQGPIQNLTENKIQTATHFTTFLSLLPLLPSNATSSLSKKRNELVHREKSHRNTR